MGKYTDPNFRCATRAQQTTRSERADVCGHFVVDHTNFDPKTDEVDHDGMIRYGCHATGAGCICTNFLDSGTEELLAIDTAAAMQKAAADKKAAAAAAAPPATPAAPAAPPATPAVPAGNP